MTTRKPRRPLLLYSGGLDSTVVLHQTKPERALFFNYGQRHKKEQGFAQEHCKQLDIRLVEIRLPKLEGSLLTDSEGESRVEESVGADRRQHDPPPGSWVVPARNLTFLAVAANYAASRGFDALVMGCNRDDFEMFGDCREGFFEFVGRALEESDAPLALEFPLINKTKEQIRDTARQLGISLKSVWSCYWGMEKPCGTCPACLLGEEA